MAKLTDKQRKFCDEYLIDLNATQAAIRAGYSEKTAKEIGCENLTKPNIQEYLQKRKADRIERVELTQDFVIKELMDIVSVNATDYARVVEKQARVDVNGVSVPLEDEDGNPLTYRTVEPLLTEELTEKQKKALAVIKRGRDGFEIKPYSKLEALKLLGMHLGLWSKKDEHDIAEQLARIEKIKAETARIKGEDPSADMQDDGFLDALRGAVDVWEE